MFVIALHLISTYSKDRDGTPSRRNGGEQGMRNPIVGFFSLLLLAALCIGVVELSVARYEDPKLYESVTAPVRDAYADAQEQLDDYLAQREAEREAERVRLEREEAERQRREQQRLQEEAERQRYADELAAEELAAQVVSMPTLKRELPLADPTITEFIEADDGREILTGGNIELIYYNQGDEAWSSLPFGRDRIGGYGCGPTALAMVLASTVDETADPASVAAWAAGAGYWAPHSGSHLSIVQGAAEHYGLECSSLGVPDADTLYSVLSSGGTVVALMGPGHFTGRGHFILLHGVTLSGGILVADPNSRENSLSVWEPELILGELSRSRHDGAPLWLLREPLAL